MTPELSKQKIRQIGTQAFEISRDGKVMGAVWKAPSPYSDWYYGRMIREGQALKLEGCGVGKTQEKAIEGLLKWRDEGGI